MYLMNISLQVLKVQVKDKVPQFLVHYSGWNKTYDGSLMSVEWFVLCNRVGQYVDIMYCDIIRAHDNCVMVVLKIIAISIHITKFGMQLN